MQAHLLIKINKDKTEIHYISEGNKLHTHDYDYGYDNGEDKHLFLSGIMYALEQINTFENVPTVFRIKMSDGENVRIIDNIMRHKMNWYKAILEDYNYTQFDTDGNSKPCVIIDSNERYKKVNRLGLKI